MFTTAFVAATAYLWSTCVASPIAGPEAQCTIGTCESPKWTDGVGLVDPDQASFILVANNGKGDGKSYIEIQTQDHQNHQTSVIGDPPVTKKGYQFPLLFDSTTRVWQPKEMTIGPYKLDVDEAIVGKGIEVSVYYKSQTKGETLPEYYLEGFRADYVQFQFKAAGVVLDTWTIVSTAFKADETTNKTMSANCQMIFTGEYEGTHEANKYRCLRALPKK